MPIWIWCASCHFKNVFDVLLVVAVLWTSFNPSSAIQQLLIIFFFMPCIYCVIKKKKKTYSSIFATDEGPKFWNVLSQILFFILASQNSASKYVISSFEPCLLCKLVNCIWRVFPPSDTHIQSKTFGWTYFLIAMNLLLYFMLFVWFMVKTEKKYIFSINSLMIMISQ